MTGAPLVVLCASGLGVGLVGVALSMPKRRFLDATGGTSGGSFASNPVTWWRQRLARLAIAALVAAVFGLLTGWPVAVPIAGVAAYALPGLFALTSGAVAIGKIEAIATWTEMLQGTLAAAAGLGQAIIATSAISPQPIRSATTRLAAQLNAGIHPRDALLQFADEVGGDPCADRVVCALVLAVTSRAQQLGDLLTALADSTREEVALRLRIETSRASVRSGVRTVLVFSIAFASGLALLAHSYLSPFGTATGQIVLALVALFYGSGLTLMVWLARPPKPVRLLGSSVNQQ
jgi:tight adherence protein B